MIWLPTIQQIMRLHEKVTERTGGSQGVRDLGLIESAIMRAKAQFGGVEAYKTPVDKAAAVCCGLVCNHGFIDGNKRVGIATMLLILKKNAVNISYTQVELIALGLGIAQDVYTVEDVATWIRSHAI